ncbi:MAG: glycosyltransferase [Anaerolineaceae bacterium]
MKVIQMIDSLGTAGTEKMVLLLARKCAEIGAPFSVISLADDTDSDISREIRALNGRVFNFPSEKLLDLKRIISIRNLLRQEKFDLVHSYLTFSNIVGCLAGRMAGVPVICSLRNLGDTPMYTRPGRRFIETICLNLFASRVMGNGYAIAEVHSRRVKTGNIDVIPNAAEIPEKLSSEERITVRKDLIGDSSRPVVISVGRLIPSKGFTELITSIALVRERIPEIVLLIAGDGIEMEKLSKQVESLGLSDHIKLLGYRKDVHRLLQASDVYASASSSEGMSVAILEGMAAGLPVVATDVGDAARVVVEGTGIVISNNAPELIASSLTSILVPNGTSVKMGHAARDHIRENYSPEVWIKKIFSLYKKTIEED